MKKRIIVTDSSCDLSDETLKKLNIRMIPLRLITSKAEYKDRVNITSEEVYNILEKEIPKTSLPQPDDISNLYEELIAEGYTDILHISLSAGLSGTCNLVNIIAENYKDKANIVVVNSKTLSAGLGLLVLRASEMLEEGIEINEIAEKLIVLREAMQGTFVVHTLEYLRKGGRIGLVEGVVGALLNIKPIIYVNSNGIYETLAKARGFAKAKSIMLSSAYDRYKNQLVDAYIVHGMVEDEAKEFSESVKEALNIRNLIIHTLSPVLGIHTGKGLIGLIVLPVEVN